MKTAVVEVKVADSAQFKAFANGVANALALFTDLTPDEMDALPGPARAALGALEDACAGARVRPLRDLTPVGSVILEWAPPSGDGKPMPGCLTSIYDTATGEPLLTVSRVRLIDVDANKHITAGLTMFADEEGNPSAVIHQQDGETITGVFRFDVSEMRIRS